MKLSTKSRYGLRILLQIALETETQTSAGGRSIAEKQEISEAYLEQIMIPLKSAGIVKTIRGCHGGYVLNRAPEGISVLDLIEIFEGKIQLVKCSDGNGKKCPRHDICMTTDVWEHLSEVLKTEAGKITLASLVEKSKTNNKPVYVI